MIRVAEAFAPTIAMVFPYPARSPSILERLPGRDTRGQDRDAEACDPNGEARPSRCSIRLKGDEHDGENERELEKTYGGGSDPALVCGAYWGNIGLGLAKKPWSN